MPPKRSKRKAPTRSPTPKASGRDKEIQEAYYLFALPPSTLQGQAEDDDDERMQGELEDHTDEETMLKILDVRRALKSLNLPPPPGNFFDAGQQLVRKEEFVELAKTLAEMDDAEGEDVDMMDEEAPQIEEKKGKNKGKGRVKATKQDREKAEIDHAFALFTTPIPNTGGFEPHVQAGRRITLSDLRRIARELREDVDESVLKMMLLEANGADGERGVTGGVGRDEFERVMRRAGVFA